MSTRDSEQAAPVSALIKSPRLWPILYTLAIFAVMVAASGYSLRRVGIFACPGDHYGEDYFLGSCPGTRYGDYDRGAFWFGLEPVAREHAAAADVLFIGNSRLEAGFSVPAMERWFSANHAHYYLLGFGDFENATFLGPLVHSLHPKARAYVINVDDGADIVLPGLQPRNFAFFIEQETRPGSDVMHGYGTRVRYESKRAWQTPHRIICTWRPALCGGEVAFYRQRETGEGRGASSGTRGRVDPGFNLPVDPDRVTSAQAVAERFIADLGVDRSCVFLTYVPPKNSDRATAAALAKLLGFDLVPPQLEGLQTLDESHLDPASAERFVNAFLDTVGPRLQRCLEPKEPAPVAMHVPNRVAEPTP